MDKLLSLCGAVPVTILVIILPIVVHWNAIATISCFKKLVLIVTVVFAVVGIVGNVFYVVAGIVGL